MDQIPEWLEAVSIGEAIAWLVGLSGLITIVAKLWKPLGKVIKAVQKFNVDWNGTDDRLDHSGAVIEKGKPGVPALLEAVRSQVQNSHSTNLRDDLDELIAKVDEHIEIAKESDDAQKKLADDVSMLMAKWGPKDGEAS